MIQIIGLICGIALIVYAFVWKKSPERFIKEAYRNDAAKLEEVRKQWKRYLILGIILIISSLL